MKTDNQIPVKLLITGASGFLGTQMVYSAIEQGYDVFAMIKKDSPRERIPLPDDHIYFADMSSKDFKSHASKAMDGIEAIIHCAAITPDGATNETLSRIVNVEGTRILYEAANEAGVRRWIQISSMSANPISVSVYGKTKLAADQILLSSNHEKPIWTILKPSLIYGPDKRGLAAKTAQILKKLPFTPVVGNGNQHLRPVFVTDVAWAALHSLKTSLSEHKVYMLGGADEMTLNEFMEKLAIACNFKPRLVHLPIWMCMLIAKTCSLILKRPPITIDNVLGVRDVQPVDHSLAQQELGYSPIGIEEGLYRTFNMNDKVL